MNYQNFIEIDNKRNKLLILYSSLFIIFVLTCSLVYIKKSSNSNKINLNSTNDYYLVEGGFLDDLQSKFRGILQYSGEFSPSDFENVTFQHPETLIPIKNLSISIELECDEIIHIKITDKENKRWESPYSISDSYQEKVSRCANTKSLSDIGFNIYFKQDEKLYYYLTLEDIPVLTSENSRFLFSDNFILFGQFLTSNFIAGFGERYHDFKLGDGIYTSWPNDTSGIHQDEGNGGHNLMGLHPIGLHKTKNNKFLGILFNNINAQDTYINSLSEENVLLEHRTIGGVIDYYLYYNENPDTVLIKLHDIIGQPIMPPYWSLGFHQCRYGYLNTQEIKDVYKQYNDKDFPIDTFWADIDILEEKRIFVLETKNFKDLPLLVNEMHSNHFRFVPIADLGFKKDENDEFYKRGHEKNAFLLSNYTDTELISYVWPGEAVFPDFFNDDMKELWYYAMNEFYKSIEYDGMWIDMNEPAQLIIINDTRGEILPEGYDYDPEKNKYEYIPYIPGYRENEHIDIRSHSLSENAKSKLYTDDPLYTSYNFKPLMALMMAENTKKALEDLEKRSFILSRSTTLGAGRYTFHWLGDNFSRFRDMRNGLTGVFNFNLFGIPMTGDDICGFKYNAWDNLCARWMALGAFFPFSRNHRDNESRNQEPYAFGINSNTYKLSKMALYLRYSLIRYYYSNLFLVSLGEKGSFFKPVFFNYYDDLKTYENIDTTVMIGDSLILFPLFQNETNEIDAYFPNDDWNFINGTKFLSKNFSKNEGTNVKLSGQYDIIHLYLRGGSIIPFQDLNKKYAKNTYYLRKNPLEIIINPESQFHTANGTFIFDNDEINYLGEGYYNRFDLSFDKNILTVKHNKKMDSKYQYYDDIISFVKIYNIEYLLDEYYDILSVYSNQGNIYNLIIDYLDNNVIICDLRKIKLKLKDINNMKLEKNNNKH